MFKRATLLIFLLFVIFFVNAFLNPIPQKNVPEGFKPKYGVSYSFEQASWYGLDGREAFADLISNYKFDWIRLPFFWNRMINESGEFNGNFDDLKFAIEEADKNGVDVIIVLGAKAPYFPEFYIPEDLATQVKNGQTINLDSQVSKNILEIDKKVIEELSLYENISHWQVENEPFTPNEKGWKLGRELVKEEVLFVRETDPKKRPIILSHVGPAIFDKRWKSLLEVLEGGDVLGVNAYFKTQAPSLLNLNVLGRQIYIPWPRGFSWPVQSWGFFSPDFAAIKNQASKKNVDVWILEMQAEPYIRDLRDARSLDFSFKASDIINADRYLRSSGIESIGFWGAHFWQFREKLGDKTWVEVIKSIVN